MKSDRQSWFPLLVGLLMSVVVHALVVPGVVGFVLGGKASKKSVLPPQDRNRPDQTLGQDHSKASSVAWISHEDFREMFARKGVTEQPALQRQVDPVETADVPSDPTENVVVPASNKDVPRQLIPRQALIEQITPQSDQEIPIPSKTILPPHQDVEGIAVKAPDTQDHSEKIPKPPVVQAPPTDAASTPKESRPTAAAKSDAESSPVSLTKDTLKIRPGKVMVGDGIELKPARPRFSVVTMASGIPDNPLAQITFDAGGKVVKVVMKRSTGYADFDGPIEASLYKWRAAGPRLEELDSGFEIDIELILVE